MNYFPSKKILVAFFLIIILVVGVFWLTRAGRERGNLELIPVENLGDPQSIEKTSEKDSDNDNLANWEEALWGTDPLNPDSDGDGALDGEEVLSNRSPLIAGPDDFQQTLAESSDGENGSEENLSLSGQFGVDFFQAYANLRGTGSTREVSPDVFYQTITENIAQVEKVSSFSLEDIRTTDNTDISIKAYGNDLGRNFTEGTKGIENELIVLAEILERRSQTAAERLREVANGHQRVLESQTSLLVPSEIRELHLDLLSTYARLVESLENLSQILSDPLVGIVGLGQYNQETENLERVIENLKEYFELRNITFNSSESGNIFNK